jgi:glutathionylspermidine synthase
VILACSAVAIATQDAGIQRRHSTALLGAAVVQWHWLEDVRPGFDQFNLIRERLIDQWRTVKTRMNPNWHVRFAGVLGEPEDIGTVRYIRDVCEQAGLVTERPDVSEIGWNGEDFSDLAGQPIHVLFKLSPWEWLLAEDFALTCWPTARLSSKRPGTW